MSDYRSYSPDLDQESEKITLSPFESHHLVSTNRARQGDEVVVFNGKGTESDTILEEANRKQAILSRKIIRYTEKPLTQYKLAIAVIKGKSFEVILRQATELGVSAIQPLFTDRTQIHWKKSASKIEKWHAHLIEACKQSGNPWLPELSNPVYLNEFLQQSHIENAFVASLEDSAQQWNNISVESSATLFVGPEGDFSPNEYRLMKEKGVEPVTLGPYVLRSETAAISGLSQLIVRINQSSETFIPPIQDVPGGNSSEEN